MSVFRATCVILVMSLVASGTLSGQGTTAAVSGVVKDSSGAVVPQAKITILHVETGTSRSVVSDADGHFRAPLLPVGNYEIRAELAGFKTEVRSGVNLVIGQEAVVDMVLTVGDVSEKVEVTGDAPLVGTTTSSVEHLINDKVIRELPLNGRSIEQLAFLQPGVQRFNQYNTSNQVGSASAFTVAGSRITGNLFLLDGNEINDEIDFTPGGAAGVLLGVDSIREFKVLTNTFDATYGRKSGGILTAISRSGTNQFHGSLFEFHRNSALDAKNYFDNPQRDIPPFKRNQFGATFGGPIVKDRTFFFVGFEGLRERLGLSLIGTVPDANARLGILPDPVTGAPRNIGVDPRVRPFLNLYPLPNGPNVGNGVAQLFASPVRSIREDNGTARIDHRFSDADSLFFRYTIDDSDATIPQVFPFPTVRVARRQWMTLEHTHVFSPSTINVARFGYNRSFNTSSARQDIATDPSMAFLQGDQFGLLIVGGLSPNFGNPTSLPRFGALNLFEYSDDINLTRGKHGLRIGGVLKRYQNNISTPILKHGRYTFTGLEQFLRATPVRFESEPQTSDTVRGYRQWLPAVYIQDDFRLRSNITLNLGLRYEFVTRPDEVNGKLANFINIMDQAPTVGELFNRNPSLTSFQPRVGFAWDVHGNGKTAVRGGFGIYYDQPITWFYSIMGSQQQPFARQTTINNPPFPNIPSSLFSTGVALNNQFSLDPEFSVPGKRQYNLTVQREVFRDFTVSAAYVGSQGYNLQRARQGNSALPIICPCTQAPTLPAGTKFFPVGSTRRNLAIGDHRRVSTDANSQYDSLQVNALKRAGNYQLQVSYTLSKSLDNASEQFPTSQTNSIDIAQDPDNLDAEWARSSFDVRNYMAINNTLDLPFARGMSGMAGKLLSGWRVTSIITLSSGPPFGIESVPGSNPSRSLNQSFGFPDRPNLVPGRSNNPVLGSPTRWFDPTAFQLQPAGTFGNLGRNTVQGPGLATVDLGLIKSTSFGEGRSVEFRTEAFNLFNRPNFATPFRQVFLAGGGIQQQAGRITATTTTSRQIQFGLKVMF